MSTDSLHELERCQLCREDVRDKLAAFDRRLVTLEIIVRGEDGRNGMKSQLSKLCERFDGKRHAKRLLTAGSPRLL